MQKIREDTQTTKQQKIPRHSQFCRQPPQAPPTHKSYNRKGGVSSPKLSDLKFNITSNYQFVCSCSIERLFGWSRRNFSEEEISNRQSITVSPPCQETINCSSFFIAAKIWEFAKSACWLGFHLDGIPNFKSKFILGRFFLDILSFMKHFSFRWILSEKFNVWISGSLPRDGWLEGNWYFHSSSLWVSLGPNMNLKRGDEKVEIPLLSIKQRPSPRLWMNGKLIPKPVYRVRRATRRYGQRGSGIKKYRRNTKCLIKQILGKNGRNTT